MKVFQSLLHECILKVSVHCSGKGEGVGGFPQDHSSCSAVPQTVGQGHSCLCFLAISLNQVSPGSVLLRVRILMARKKA